MAQSSGNTALYVWEDTCFTDVASAKEVTIVGIVYVYLRMGMMKVVGEVEMKRQS